MNIHDPGPEPASDSGLTPDGTQMRAILTAAYEAYYSSGCDDRADALEAAVTAALTAYKAQTQA